MEKELTFEEYKNECSKIIIYPQEISLAYLSLGAIGEYFEFKEKVDKLCPDPGMCQHTMLKKISEDTSVESGDILSIHMELGDIFWYTSNIHREFDIGDFQYRTHFHSSRVIDVLGFSIGSLCECVKKYYRDEDYKKSMSEERKKIITDIVYKIDAVMNSICFWLNVKPTYIWQLNIEKLQSRKNRGVLSGSGDYR